MVLSIFHLGCQVTNGSLSLSLALSLALSLPLSTLVKFRRKYAKEPIVPFTSSCKLTNGPPQEVVYFLRFLLCVEEGCENLKGTNVSFFFTLVHSRVQLNYHLQLM